MAWSRRPEWAPLFDTVMHEHVIEAREEFGIESDGALIEEIGDGLFMSTVFGSAFEDFLTREREEGAGTIVDEYLRRRGYMESVPGRRYLEALRDSVVSLYEVVESVPDSHLVLRDRLRGGEPVRVEERSGSRQLVRWDSLACRVVPLNRQFVMSGAPLRFEPEEADRLEKALAKAAKEAERKLPEQAAGVPRDQRRAVVVTSLLGQSAPLFTWAWLAQTLRQLRAPPPEIRNSDGDPIVFIETRWPIAEDARVEIAQRLDRAEEQKLYRADEDAPSWRWLGERSLVPGMPVEAVTYDPGPLEDEAGRVSLGSVRLDGGDAILETNSESRAARGRALVEGLLGDRIGAARMTRRSLDEMRAERENDPSPPANELDSGLDPEDRARLLGEYKARYYREWLDGPVPALGGRTPRQAARTRNSRPKVVALLKELENRESRWARDEGVPAGDYGWLWRELGLSAEDGKPR
jgi:hypothetical protein